LEQDDKNLRLAFRGKSWMLIGPQEENPGCWLAFRGKPWMLISWSAGGKTDPKKENSVWTLEKPDTLFGNDFMAKPKKKKNLSETSYRYNTLLSCCWLLRCDTTKMNRSAFSMWLNCASDIPRMLFRLAIAK